MDYISDLFLKVFTILYRGGVCMISECRIFDYCWDIPIADQSNINSQRSYETEKRRDTEAGKSKNEKNTNTNYELVSFFSF
jgi:hypothetical protein